MLRRVVPSSSIQSPLKTVTSIFFTIALIPSSSSLKLSHNNLRSFSHYASQDRHQTMLKVEEQRQYTKQVKTQEEFASENGVQAVLPHADSPLIRAVHAELFRLCTTPHPTLTTPTTSPSNPHWINIGLVTKNLPDDLLEDELGKFTNGGVKEIIGRYISLASAESNMKKKRVELQYDVANKRWLARTEPIDDDLVNMSDLASIVLDMRGPNQTPFEVGRFGTILKTPFASNILPVEAAKKFFTPQVHVECRALHVRLMKKHDRSLMRVMWRCHLHVPTCRFDVVKRDDGAHAAMDLLLARDKFMRPLASAAPKANRLQIEQLKEFVPTYFIPMEMLMGAIRAKGYTEEHVFSLFNLSSNVQIVTLPINNKSYIRIHGGKGENHMIASWSTNELHRAMDPITAPRAAKQYVKLLQEYFKSNVERLVREKFAAASSTSEMQPSSSSSSSPFAMPSSPFDQQRQFSSSSSMDAAHHHHQAIDYHFTPSQINDVKWCSLRKLLELGGSELESQIPHWRGPEALLYFAQLQHLFCFTPGGAPDGGFVCLQAYFYPTVMDVAIPVNNSTTTTTTTIIMKRRVKLPVSSFAHDPRSVFGSVSALIAGEPSYITPLPVQSLHAENCPMSIFITELGTFLKKKKRNADDPELNKSASISDLLAVFGGKTLRRKTGHLSFPDILDPFFDLAQPEYVVPYEEQPNHHLYYQRHNQQQQHVGSTPPHWMIRTSTSAEEGVKERSFEDYMKLICRLHYKILIFDIEQRRVVWCSAAHLRVRLRLPLQEQLRLAIADNAPKHKIRAIEAKAARIQDPTNPWWDTFVFFAECVVHCIPKDRYCTIGEFYNFLLPRQFLTFVPSLGVYSMFRKFGQRNGIIVFNMNKSAHYHNVMKQYGFTSIDEMKHKMGPAMFEAFGNCRTENVKEHFACCMRVDGEYYQKVLGGGGKGGKIVLPEGAVPLEASSEELAQIVVDILLRFGENTTTSSPNEALSATYHQHQQETTMYRMNINILKERLPLLTLEGGKNLHVMHDFIGFLEKHPEKFLLVTSGKVVNSVILNWDYLRKKMNAKDNNASIVVTHTSPDEISGIGDEYDEGEEPTREEENVEADHDDDDDEV